MVWTVKVTAVVVRELPGHQSVSGWLPARNDKTHTQNTVSAYLSCHGNWQASHWKILRCRCVCMSACVHACVHAYYCLWVFVWGYDYVCLHFIDCSLWRWFRIHVHQSFRHNLKFYFRKYITKLILTQRNLWSISQGPQCWVQRLTPPEEGKKQTREITHT